MKVFILILWLSLLTQCGTEVGNHFKDPEPEIGNNNDTPSPSNLPDASIEDDGSFSELISYAEHAFFLECGSVFKQELISPLELFSNDNTSLTGVFSNGTWGIDYNDIRSYSVSTESETNSILVQDSNGQTIENQFTCEDEKDLTGAGDPQEKTRFITISRNEENYKAVWIIDETTTPHTLLKLELRQASDDMIILELQ